MHLISTTTFPTHFSPYLDFGIRVEGHHIISRLNIFLTIELESHHALFFSDMQCTATHHWRVTSTADPVIERWGIDCMKTVDPIYLVLSRKPDHYLQVSCPIFSVESKSKISNYSPEWIFLQNIQCRANSMELSSAIRHK